MRVALWFLAVAAIALTASPPASAHGSHTRFFLGLNFGPPCCYYGPRYFYGPAYYAPPPVYYYMPPPPAYYYPPPPPPPVYYAPPPAAYAPAPVPASYCREYRGDASIDSSGAPFYGRACLMPDGKWHIVN